MPVHDWTLVDDGVFHDFHLGWIAALRTALNTGVLPSDYYARGEQVAGGLGPDVLTLQRPVANGEPHPRSASCGGAVAKAAPPVTAFTFVAEVSEYTARQRSILIRHRSNHRVVAIIEVVSHGNKASTYAFDTFITKVAGALAQGIHVLILDLHPPTPRDPNGIHAAIWETIHAGTFTPPADRPLTLAGYDAGPIKRAYVEPTAVGRVLTPMPLFLEPGYHVSVPLEQTYLAAWAGMPGIDREALEGPAGGAEPMG